MAALQCRVLVMLLVVGVALHSVHTQGLGVSVLPVYSPPEGLRLRRDQYRAASQLTLSCQATGATGTLSYMWSSTCTGDCFFEFLSPTSQNISTLDRGAINYLLSADSGTYTCQVTDDGSGLQRSASRLVTVVGVGAYALEGSTGAGPLPDNALVRSTPSLRVLCASGTEMSGTDVGSFIDRNGMEFGVSSTTGSVTVNFITLYPGEMEFNSSGVVGIDRGVYTCRMRDENNVLQDFNVGVYESGFVIAASVINVTISLATRSLGCFTTGSIPTTVLWTKDSMLLAIDGLLYSTTQCVTNRATSSFDNRLVLEGVADVAGTYSCRVQNDVATTVNTVATVLAPPVWAAILLSTSPIAGQPLTLTCTVTLAPGTAATPTVTWTGPAVNSGIQAMPSSGEYTLSFEVLQEAFYGSYGCMATAGVESSEHTVSVVGDVPEVVVILSSDKATLPATAGESLTLTCAVTGVTDITYSWSQNGMDLSDSTGTLVFGVLQVTDGGVYECQATFGAGYLSSSLTVSSDPLTVDVTIPVPPFMSVSFHPAEMHYAGLQLKVDCLAAYMNQLTGVSMAFTWSGPQGTQLMDGDDSGRITIGETGNPGTQFTSTLTFAPLSSTLDPGTYNCSVVTFPSSQSEFTVGNGTGSVTGSLSVEAPVVAVEVTPSSVRALDTPPFNSFSLSCSATSSLSGGVPVGMAKVIVWQRRVDPSGSFLVQTTGTGGVVISNSADLAQATVTSMLTVTGVAMGDYTYWCLVSLDLSRDDISGSDDAAVTIAGPSLPFAVSNVRVTDVLDKQAVVRWTVTQLAYTPEMYLVLFGTSEDTLNRTSTAVESGQNIDISELARSVTLLELDASTQYFLQVEATNSVGSMASLSANFTTIRPVPPPPRELAVARSGPTSFSFSWLPPVAIDGILDYRVSCEPSLEGIGTATASTSLPSEMSVLVEGLENGVQYSCTVAARDEAGLSLPSNAVNVTADAAAPTGPPLLFTLTAAGQRALNFSWALPQPEDRNGDIADYTISCTPAVMATFSGLSGSVGGLRPATMYSCSVSARNQVGVGPGSVSVEASTMEAAPSGPPLGFTFMLFPPDHTTVQFTWQPPAPEVQNGAIIRYTVDCISTTPPSDLTEKSVDPRSQPSLSVNISAFAGSTRYTCSVIAATIAGDSDPPGTLELITVPARPENLVSMVTGATSVRLNWSITPNQNIARYMVSFNGATVSTPGSDLSFDVSGLEPFTDYTFRVSAVNSDGVEGGESSASNSMTAEAPPSAPTDVQWVRIDNGQVSVVWDSPARPNGVVTGYTVRLMYYEGSVIEARTVARTAAEATFNNSELAAGTPYSASVRAENGAGEGVEGLVLLEFTQDLVPSIAPTIDEALTKRLNGSHLEVAIVPLTPVQARGLIVHYLVTLTPSESSRRRQDLTGSIPAGSTSTVIGGLATDRAYLVAVAARTGAGLGVASVGFEVLTPPPSPSSTPIVGIVIGCVVGAIVLATLMALLVILCCLCNPSCKPGQGGRKSFHPVPSDYTMQRRGGGEEEQLPPGKSFEQSEGASPRYESVNTYVFNRMNAISVSQFSSHVRSMHEDRDNGFEQEYESFSNALLAANVIAGLSCNKQKNRFANIYPYDFSRVKLREIEDTEGSDFINASYVDGYGHPNAYIAAQGPLPNTVVDFWRMVWQHRLSKVVMLTRYVEAGKRKCEQYWPDNVDSTMEVGENITVTLTTLQPFADFEIRVFNVQDHSDSEADPLEVTHFYFLGWPDHGVPQFATSLIAFIRRVRHGHSCAAPPLLVHCSAGVGRTGTYILLDSMLERLKVENTVNVYEFLGDMRAKRVFMVQTLPQYIFIHDTLDELITCGETDIAASELRTAINELHRVRPSSNTGFSEQFELLAQVSRRYTENDSTDALLDCNQPKNRYPDRLPYNSSRVRLMPSGASGADYINASFIDGYKRRNAFIATQGPLEETVEDFWKMVWEFKSKAILMLSNKEEEGEEVAHQFWPQGVGDTEVYGKLSVTLKSESPGDEVYTRKLVVKEEKGDQQFVVMLLQHCHWPEDARPPSTSAVLSLLDQLDKVQRSTGNRPVTVLCNDGVGRTGTFICIHAQLERLKTEGVVDFFQYTKSARIHRAGLVTELEHYIFCHDTIADFLDTFESYSNFK